MINVTKILKNKYNTPIKNNNLIKTPLNLECNEFKRPILSMRYWNSSLVKLVHWSEKLEKLKFTLDLSAQNISNSFEIVWKAQGCSYYYH